MRHLNILLTQTTGALIRISENYVISRLFFISFVTLLATACSFIKPYKFDIPQGNQITNNKLEQVTVGMTPAQVVYIMGTPAIQDPFTKDRWDYIFYLTSEKREIRKRLVTLMFEDGKLASIDEKYNSAKNKSKKAKEPPKELKKSHKPK